MDKLDKLFEMQANLNDYIFKKKNVTDTDGRVLTTDALYCGHDIDASSDTNKWLRNFLEALNDESRELKDELLWKWWSNDTLNIQNIRVEIIDQLHFWISLAMTAGMSADEVYSIYCQKNKVNLKRQENGYSKATKTEDDNKGIK